MPRFDRSLLALLPFALAACGSTAVAPEPAPPAPAPAPAGTSFAASWGGSPAATAPAEEPAPASAAAAAWSAPAGARPAPRAARPHQPSPRVQLGAARVSGLSIEDEESLRAALSRLQTASGVPIVVHPSAENAALDAGMVIDLDVEHAMLARDVLNLIVEQAGPEVVWVVKHGVVLVTTKELDTDRYVLAFHDMRALTTPRTDFLAPRIDRIRLLDDMEDDDGGGPFGGVGEVVAQYTDDDLVTMIQESVAPETWDEEGVSIDAYQGTLVVKHTREVQRQVRRFLAVLGS